MPIRNEAAFIARSLGAVLDQDYPADRMQVLVADGMSDDATRAIVEEIAATHPAHTVEIVDNPGGVVPTGFNAALSRARGEIVVRVDGHTIIADDYVSACVTALGESGADTVGGRMDAQGRGRIGEVIALATSSRFGVGDAQFHYASGEHWVDSVYMGAWRREVFDRVGGFDPEMVRNQDDEFNYRLRAAGGRILLTDRIRSRYYSRASLRTLFRQYRQYGFWKVRVLQKHPRQMSLRQFVPPVFAAAVAGGAVLAPTSRGVRRLWSATLAAYGLAAVGASVTVARRSGWRHLPLLPVAFAAMHLGYGGGFLAGLVRFARRWGERSEAPPCARSPRCATTRTRSPRCAPTSSSSSASRRSSRPRSWVSRRWASSGSTRPCCPGAVARRR
jgi:glycosyltransferase involved in cell wall biosynthesis